MHNIPINDVLNHSATNTVRPFLQTKEPDFLLASDIEFEEREFSPIRPLELHSKTNRQTIRTGQRYAPRRIRKNLLVRPHQDPPRLDQLTIR
jgi:hypothetical protein